MAKAPIETEPQRQNGKAVARQPYSVDPAASPKIGHNAAGPKRSQKQSGQALDNPTESKEPTDQ